MPALMKPLVGHVSPPFFTIALGLTLTLAATAALGAPRIVGSKVIEGGSTSTCRLVDTEGDFCSGALLIDGTVRTAGHCGRTKADQQLNVICGSGPSSAGLQARVHAIRSHPRKNTPSAQHQTLPQDSAELDLGEQLKELAQSSGVVPVSPAGMADFFEAEAPRPLQAGVRCWSESWGPDFQGIRKLRSAPLPHLTYEDGIIRFQLFSTLPKKVCPECFQSDFKFGRFKFINPAIYTRASIKKLYPYFGPPEFLSIGGDSGSPLYCAHPQKPGVVFLVGTLSGSLNWFDRNHRTEKHLARVRIGTYWIPIFDRSELTVINTLQLKQF